VETSKPLRQETQCAKKTKQNPGRAFVEVEASRKFGDCRGFFFERGKDAGLIRYDDRRLIRLREK
jgi:hypothetical protein